MLSKCGTIWAVAAVMLSLLHACKLDLERISMSETIKSTSGLFIQAHRTAAAELR